MTSSCGSFAGISSEIKRFLLAEKALAQYIVLDYLGVCANHLGITHVGIRTIAEECHYSPKRIDQFLSYFGSQDWVRLHEQDHLGSKLSALQLSPSVLYIRPQLIGQAWGLFSRACAYTPIYARTILDPESLPEKNPEKESRKKTRNTSNQKTPPASFHHQNQGNEQMTVFSQDSGVSPDQRDSAKTGASQDFIPPNSARPPLVRNEDYAEYHAPLLNDDAELYAAILAKDYGTRMSQARHLVDSYGIPLIEQSIEHVAKEMKRKVVHNPVGLMTWWLSHNVLKADE